MKKGLFILAGLALSFGAIAQKSKVQAAYNYEKKGLYDKAMEAIEMAIKHEQTSGSAKTWIYRGMIYQGIAASTDEKYAPYQDSALGVALTSYMKGLELDKDEQRYSGKAFMQFPALHDVAYNKGLDFFNAKNYEKATESFGISAGAFQFMGQIDTSAIYNAALSADLGKIDSLAIPMYSLCTQFGYGEGDTYLQLAQVYWRSSDTTMYVNTLEAGLDEYPSNEGLIRELANFYLLEGDLEMAEAQLQMAIEFDPENPDLIWTIGAVYQDLGSSEKAYDSYKRALEIDPDHINSNYNLGALLLEEGAEISEQANELSYKESTKIAALNKKADAKFAEAVPYLEAVRRLDSADTDVLKSLMQIYSRMGETEKYMEAKAALDAAAAE